MLSRLLLLPMQLDYDAYASESSSEPGGDEGSDEEGSDEEGSDEEVKPGKGDTTEPVVPSPTPQPNPDDPTSGGLPWNPSVTNYPKATGIPGVNKVELPDGGVLVTDDVNNTSKVVTQEEYDEKVRTYGRKLAADAAKPSWAGEVVSSGFAAIFKPLGALARGINEALTGGDPDKIWAEAVKAADGNPELAVKILKGEAQVDPETNKIVAKPTSTKVPGPSTPPPKTEEIRTGKTSPEGTTSGGQPTASTASAAKPPSAGVGAFAKPDTTADERARFEALVRSYNPQSSMQQFSPVLFQNPENQYIAQAGQRMNDQLAGVAQSEAFAAQERARLAALTKYTPENRDAWKQYYNPQDYKAQATQAQAAQAGMTTVAPAQTAQGEYQANLAQMQGYDPAIARSDLRGAAVETQQMMMDRAKGLKPSVAEESFKSNLDRLIASQGAAAGAIRGQDQALAQRNLASMATQQGQQAVRETAILRMQEQQAAEQAAAAQANAVMIQDEKVASEQKVNELNRNIQILSADLQNQRNLLERDTFNADAMNRANQLQAQLDSQVRQLNAQLQNQTNLHNAEVETKVSLQNALQALEANKYAGTMAQQSLAAQMAQERGDFSLGYGIGSKPIEDRAAVTSELTKGLAALGGAKEGWTASEKTRQDAANRFEQELALRKDLSEAQKENARTNFYVQIAKGGVSFAANVVEAFNTADKKDDDNLFETLFS